jgi:hypothetical protein
MKRSVSAEKEETQTQAWRCILNHCGRKARDELLKDAAAGRWVRNAFVMDGIEEFASRSHLPADINKKRYNLRLDPEIRDPGVLIRIWVTMSKSPSRVDAFTHGKLFPFLKTFRGSGLAHPQYAEIAQQAAKKNLAADHALIEFRKPATDGRPGKSWSIGFAGDKGRFLSASDASVRSYDWWFNDKLWRSLDRIKHKKIPAGEEIPAVLIGMGKMTEEHVKKLENLLRESETVVLEEYKSPTDYRIYLNYPPNSDLARFSMIIFNKLHGENQNVLNCIGFALKMFPDIIQCPSGILEPGKCSGIPPYDHLDEKWCDMSGSCLNRNEGEERPVKRLRT